MRRGACILLASALAAVPPALVPAGAPAADGCLATNPGNLRCVYQATRTGTIVAAGRGFNVWTSSGEHSWRASTVPGYDIKPFSVHPGDYVAVDVFLPGGAVYVGDPGLVPQDVLTAPAVGTGPAATTPEPVPADLAAAAFIGAPRFLVGWFQGVERRYYVAAYATTDPGGTESGVRVVAVEQRTVGAPDAAHGTLDQYTAVASDDVVLDPTALRTEAGHGETLVLDAELPNLGRVILHLSSPRAGYLVVQRKPRDDTASQWEWAVETSHGHDMNEGGSARTSGTIGSSFVWPRDGAWGGAGTGFARFIYPVQPD